MPGRNLRRYLVLFVAQTVCAVVLLANIQFIFRILIENIGTPNAPPATSVTQILTVVALGQACYWYRLRNVPVPAGYRNVALGHLFAFASRLSFIFGGALFSLYFLRHAPVLTLSLLDTIWRGGLLIGVLFALYCYTLELERLGVSLQMPPKL